MQGWTAGLLSCLSIPLSLLTTVPIAPTGVSSKVWLEDPLEYENLLRTAEIVTVEDLGAGRTRPRKVTLREGRRTLHGVFKPIERGRHEWSWESYQAEVVAYELDKLLGLNMVPPTVERSIRGEKGSLQLWVDGARLFENVQETAPKTEKWERELSRMKTFDDLVCNAERRPADFMVDGDWNIILIDHSQCFLSKPDLNPEPEMRPSRFDRKLVAKLKELTLERLQVHFSRLLMDSQVNSIMSRRDELLDHIDRLVAEKGEKAVFF